MQRKHTVKSFDEELDNLDGIIVEMGRLAESQLVAAIEVVIRRDKKQVARIRKADRRLDFLEAEVDKTVVRIIALRQPVANDLRTSIAALKTASHLERIGDHVKNIALRSKVLAKSRTIKNASHSIANMGELVRKMIVDVMDAYVKKDADKADLVRLSDIEVDLCHTSLFRELLTYMMENPRNITPCSHLLFIAKDIERIGDQVTSVAEYVHFMVHGKKPEKSRPKGDKTSSVVVDVEDVKTATPIS
jgi:phosphate transport system protein